MTPGGIEAVLFDIDDTLLDHTGASRRALRAMAAGEAPGLDDGGHEDAWVEWQRLEALHYDRYLAGEIDVHEQRRRRAGGLLAHLERPDPGGRGLDGWFGRFLDAYRAEWTAFDDVAPALTALGELPRGVITNAIAELQARKLGALGLTRRLGLMVASSEVGRPKPDALIFTAAAARLGLPPERVAYVGDRLETDARGATTAGMLGIWLDRDGAGPEPGDVPRIRTLSELPAALGLAAAERAS